MMSAEKGAEFRQGWQPLLASIVGIGFGITGLAFYCFGVFVVPLSEAFGWTRGQATLGSSFLIIGTAISAPIIGTIIDRYGARRVGLISMFGVAIGFLALSQINGSLPVFYAAWLLLSVAAGGTTPVVFTRAMGMWFDKARGLALGITLAGSGLAGIFGPSLCTALIRAYGWQGGFIGIGLVTLVIAIPIVALFFKERVVTRTPAGPAVSGISTREALRTGAFWQIACGFIIVSSVVALLVVHFVPLLRDRGMSPTEAANLAGVMGIAIVVGRVAVGHLVDHFGGSAVARIVLPATAAGCLLLTIPGAPVWVPTISAASIGFAAAAEVNLLAYLTSRHFGMRAYGKIYGWQITSFYIGAAVGPLAAGAAYDHFHGYTQALYVATGLLLVGAAIVGSLGRPPEYAQITAG